MSTTVIRWAGSEVEVAGLVGYKILGLVVHHSPLAQGKVGKVR